MWYAFFLLRWLTLFAAGGLGGGEHDHGRAHSAKPCSQGPAQWALCFRFRQVRASSHSFIVCKNFCIYNDQNGYENNANKENDSSAYKGRSKSVRSVV
jgi:hypothetical protein